jgi:hydroxymethylbilane synthase
MTASLRVGTRGSSLALVQANYVASRLRAVAGSRPVELVEIETAGDQARDAPLSQIGGEGVFTKAIQQALLSHTVDVAVHSLKDLPTLPVAGLALAAVPPRASTGDAFVSRKFAFFQDLPRGATVATGSLRRRAQALHRRPDLQIVSLRGNVETRLRKLVEEELDGLILAQAGLQRLGLGEKITEILDPGWMLPAIGQGALGLECRADDIETQGLLAGLDDPPAHRAVRAERSFLRALGGGCLMPIGALAIAGGTELHIRGVVLSPDGDRRIEGEAWGSVDYPQEAGERLAADLLGRGAKELLQRN